MATKRRSTRNKNDDLQSEEESVVESPVEEVIEPDIEEPASDPEPEPEVAPEPEPVVEEPQPVQEELPPPPPPAPEPQPDPEPVAPVVEVAAEQEVVEAPVMGVGSLVMMPTGHRGKITGVNHKGLFLVSKLANTRKVYAYQAAQLSLVK
jgi:hypothetical protein